MFMLEQFVVYIMASGGMFLIFSSWPLVDHEGFPGVDVIGVFSVEVVQWVGP